MTHSEKSGRSCEGADFNLAGWAQESPEPWNELLRNFETKPYQQNQQELKLNKHLPFKQHHETTINKQGNPSWRLARKTVR